jgi:hypothetical protein
MKLQVIARLVNTIHMAIECGDWKVDGRCDLCLDIEEAEKILKDSGKYLNHDGMWYAKKDWRIVTILELERL